MKINSIIRNASILDKVRILFGLIFFSASGLKEKYQYASRLPSLFDSLFYYILIPIIVLLAFIGPVIFWVTIIIVFVIIKILFLFSIEIIESE